MRGGDLGCRGRKGGRASELLPAHGVLPGCTDLWRQKTQKGEGGPDIGCALREGGWVAMPPPWLYPLPAMPFLPSFFTHSPRVSFIPATPFGKIYLVPTRLSTKDIMVPPPPTQKYPLTCTVLAMGDKLYWAKQSSLSLWCLHCGRGDRLQIITKMCK